MRNDFPVFTLENECQDCYKCVRHCPCKAIRIVNAKASVIPDACVACGECVKVCPAHAKQIRSDLARLRAMLESGVRLYASVAPSFVGYFKKTGIGNLAAALKKLGFFAVGETALGAEAVSAKTSEFLRTHPEWKIAISSACPACVDFIRKYHPEFSASIVPVASPVLSHCKLVRDRLGEDIRTVFIGPCAAKKNESDAHPELLSLAITFQTLENLLEEREIAIDDTEAEVFPRPAEEGRFYSVEGGMNDTLRDGNPKVRHIAVSGLDRLDRLLSGFDAAPDGGRTIFIEALACRGGCVSGPVMPADGGTLDTLIRTDRKSPVEASAKRKIDSNIALFYHADPITKKTPSEVELAAALARVGKFSKSDELNCGACGYNTCRDFACALLENKAEEAMCHNYLRKNFQRTSNALIKYISAGVVIVNDKLEITESNRHFAKLVNGTEVFDNLGNLNTIRIEEFLPDFADLFESVLANGGEIEEFNQNYGDKIVNLSVFSVAQGKYAGAVVQDVTKPELQREQIAEKAKEVIRKNVLTVQKVARIFGEHIAESEILLNEIAGSYQGVRKEKADE